jgi:hypothetical protein
MIEHVIDGERTARLVVGHARRRIGLPFLRRKDRASVLKVIHG